MKKVKEFLLKYYVCIFCLVLITIPFVYMFTNISKVSYALVLLVSYILFEIAEHVNKKRKVVK